MVRGRVLGVVMLALDVPEYALAAGCLGSMDEIAAPAPATPAKK